MRFANVILSADTPCVILGEPTGMAESRRSAERTKWLASFPEQNPNPVIEADLTAETIHYENPAAIRLFPDLQSQRREHPFLAGLTTVAEAFQNGNREPVQREITVNGRNYAQTISYHPESRRLRIYGMDITARKLAEEQLTATLKEVHDLKDALDEHAIVAITDAHGRITHVNAKFCAISKYARTELLGQDHRLINSGHHPKEFIRDLWTTIARGNVWHGEIKNKAKDGSYYWVDTTIVPFLDAAGKPRQYVAIRADITDRKQAEESQKRLVAIVNSSDDAIIGKTLAGIITDWNAGAEVLFGYTAAEAIGKPGTLIFPPDRLKEEEAILARIARGESLKHYETVRVRKDGGLVDVSVTVSPILDQAGNIVGASKVARDITERKRAEAEILRLNAELEARVVRRTAELEAANRELEAFSYSVSHDLRAPLRAVNGFAGMVLDEFGSQLPTQGRHYLERIRNGGLRMGELIDDLLTFARLSRQPMNRRQVDNARLVAEVLAELNPAGNSRPVETRIGALPPCLGDPALLKQVWTNLLSNALKYTRGREPAVIEIGCQQTDGEYQYFVRDNGVGFDMQYAHKLFGVFQRLHRAEEFEGTGVGLAIVQRVIHRHGGQISAIAEPGRGAMFSFTLEGDIHDDPGH
jgi:PAS domain S-box-containing protein